MTGAALIRSLLGIELLLGSPALTELVQFPDRGHSLVFDSGRKELAGRVHDWLAATVRPGTGRA